MAKMTPIKGELESLIAEIYELLNEIKNEQNKTSKEMEKHHKVTMKKLDQLRQFNEIADMTNQIFEKRISSIEQTLKKLISQKEN